MQFRVSCYPCRCSVAMSCANWYPHPTVDLHLVSLPFPFPLLRAFVVVLLSLLLHPVAGANVNSRSKHGCTPLFHAAKGGNLAIVQKLLGLQVDVNAEASDGATAIFEAAKGGNVKCMVELRAHGADPFHGVSYGATPLHIASFHGHAGCLQQLLAWGANPNSRTSEGCTALHYAAYMGQPHCVNVLLRVGAEPKIASVESEWSKKHANQSRYPIDYAREQYNCKDGECVCHQQQPDLAKKKMCHDMFLAWSKRTPTLQELARRAYRRAAFELQDYNATVAALPVGTVIKAYLIHEAELGPWQAEDVHVSREQLAASIAAAGDDDDGDGDGNCDDDGAVGVGGTA